MCGKRATTNFFQDFGLPRSWGGGIGSGGGGGGGACGEKEWFGDDAGLSGQFLNREQ